MWDRGPRKTVIVNRRDTVHMAPKWRVGEVDIAHLMPVPPVPSQQSSYHHSWRLLNATSRKLTQERDSSITVTLVFASNVHEFETSVALADVTPKGVGALPKARAGDSSSSAFINI